MPKDDLGEIENFVDIFDDVVKDGFESCHIVSGHNMAHISITNIDEILEPYFGSWESKGDTFYFVTNANEVAVNELKQSISKMIEEIIGKDAYIATNLIFQNGQRERAIKLGFKIGGNLHYLSIDEMPSYEPKSNGDKQ